MLWHGPHKVTKNVAGVSSGRTDARFRKYCNVTSRNKQLKVFWNPGYCQRNTWLFGWFRYLR